MTSKRARYLLVAAGLLLVELLIATGFIPGTFVRGSIGDVLAIALIHCVLRGSIRCRPGQAAFAAIACGFAVEAAQFARLGERLGLDPGGLLAVTLGSTFSLADLAMYALGGGAALYLDLRLSPAQPPPTPR